MRAAVADGRLEAARLENLRGLERELRSLELRRDEAARRAADRSMSRLYRDVQKVKKLRRMGRS